MCIPYNEPNLVNASGTLASPFVLAIRACNLFGLAHALNAFILITVISCGITSAYIASRTLCALSDLKWVHPVFGRKDRQGRPYVAMTVSMILGGGLCYLNCNSTAEQVYNWFSSLVSAATLLPNSKGNSNRGKILTRLGLHRWASAASCSGRPSTGCTSASGRA